MHAKTAAPPQKSAPAPVARPSQKIAAAPAKIGVSGRQKASAAAHGTRPSSRGTAVHTPAPAKQGFPMGVVMAVVGLVLLVGGVFFVANNQKKKPVKPKEPVKVEKPVPEEEVDWGNAYFDKSMYFDSPADAPADAELYIEIKTKKYIDVKKLHPLVKNRITRNSMVFKKASPAPASSAPANP